jgi:hypothetical protein
VIVAATLLLPGSSLLQGVALPPVLARALARADLQVLGGDAQDQLARHFTCQPDASGRWPVAALTRQLDAADAGDGRWLRADPAHIAADMQGVRMLAHGPALAITPDHGAQLAASLAPVFDAHGLQLSAPDPARWYLRLPAAMVLPPLVDIDQVLGDDLFDHLPQGEPGRLWRSLLSETQVLLHQHPLNARRSAQGQAAVNSLWFWGAGNLPDRIGHGYAQIRSPDPLLQAMAKVADSVAGGHQLVDLRHLRNAQTLLDQALLPLLAALEKGELEQLQLDFADGLHYRLRRNQRWRFWRGSQRTLAR